MRDLGTLCGIVVAALAVPAAAHIELDVPTVRYSNGLGEVNKSCPCGAAPGDQTCSNGSATSDPNRDESRATALAPGSTIIVRWRETVGHVGRFRVAFDEDGADLADFNAQILADIADRDDDSGERSVEVTLPSVECDNCTMQLIQDMNNDDVDPVVDPTGDRTYFQCADMTLVDGAPSELEEGCSSSSSSSTRAPAAPAALLLILAARCSRRTSRAPPR